MRHGMQKMQQTKLKLERGRCILKQILIIAGVAVMVVVSFGMYCCMRMASQQDQMLERMRRRKNTDN